MAAVVGAGSRPLRRTRYTLTPPAIHTGSLSSHGTRRISTPGHRDEVQDAFGPEVTASRELHLIRIARSDRDDPTQPSDGRVAGIARWMSRSK